MRRQGRSHAHECNVSRVSIILYECKTGKNKMKYKEKRLTRRDVPLPSGSIKDFSHSRKKKEKRSV